MSGVPAVAASWLMVVPFVAGLGRGGPFPPVGLRARRRRTVRGSSVTILPQGMRPADAPGRAGPALRRLPRGARPCWPAAAGRRTPRRRNRRPPAAPAGRRRSAAASPIAQMPGTDVRKSWPMTIPPPGAVVSPAVAASSSRAMRSSARITRSPFMLEPSSKTMPEAGRTDPARVGTTAAGRTVVRTGRTPRARSTASACPAAEPGADQDAQGAPAEDPGDVLDGLAQPGGVVDRGVAQAAGGAFHRRLGGGGPGGDDELVVAELHAVGGGDAAVLRVDVAGRLAEADRHLGQGGELQQFLGGVIPVAEHGDGAGERGPGELADQGLRGRTGAGDDDPGPAAWELAAEAVGRNRRWETMPERTCAGPFAGWPSCGRCA